MNLIRVSLSIFKIRSVILFPFLFFVASCSKLESLPKTYLWAIQKQDLEAAFELLCDNRLPNGEIPLKHTESWKIIETQTLDISGVEMLETLVEISTKDESELRFPPKVYSLKEIDAEDMRLLIENSEYDLSPFEPKHYKSSGRCFSLISQASNRN